ncbi:QWRF motif-containing protein 7-like [Macadamia integrifolia]|uniref:QWRF motif-containing protein 7-like n=1 Tax=Macadamia integrifolia TaxID=60698 RepID=UPI001C52C0DB|nr:QWRF motif-containing protein 7-like [Macadamia integrifolia]XP_042521138.1 QWRF motif-containing protein 7-like [Macadamia integrifolia]XP_042521139.1 QWRF motif-containing protein 7-like [Macadamia integrifolia]
MPDIPPLRSNSGRKPVDRPNFPTRTRTISTKSGGEENRNPSSSKTTPIPSGIKKKPQEKTLIVNPVINLQRHRNSNPDVIKTVEKLKTKKTSSVSPSAWALSTGRTSSTIPVPKKLPDLTAKTKLKSPDLTDKTKPKSRSVRSVLNSFRQKKSSPIQEEAFHQLRIMHSRLLQWKFVNARTESTLAAKKNFAEEKILKVWSRNFHLRNSNAEKRLQIQQLKNEIKINRIFNPQIFILNQWENIEKKHSEAVGRIGRKLLALATALPLIDAAKADTESVQNAMLAAMGVMDSIEATITRFISQVGFV